MTTSSYVALDLESLGTLPGCPILSCGAVRYCVDGIYDTFEMYLKLDEQFRAGLIPSESTFLWWLNRSDDARAAQVNAHRVDSDEFAPAIAAFLAKEGSQIMTFGADFDLPVLNVYLDRLGHDMSFGYRKSSCWRTLKLEHSGKIVRTVDKCAHNALQDAIDQAQEHIQLLQQGIATLES